MKGSLLIFDIKFQFRHGFYYAYLFVSAVYILLLRFIPGGYRTYAATIMVFSDPGVMGFFFVGGILLLERGQGILDPLFVTPLQPRAFILSKCLSLAVLAVSTSLVILLATFGFSFRALPLVVGVVLSSFIATLAGLGLAARASTLNGYLVASPLFLLPFSLPLVDYLGLFPSALFYVLPGKASLVLIDGAFGRGTGLEMVYAAFNLVVWSGLAYYWAGGVFYRSILLKAGGETR
jgi:fluoroquinolone transport system permease protein